MVTHRSPCGTNNGAMPRLKYISNVHTPDISSILRASALPCPRMNRQAIVAAVESDTATTNATGVTNLIRAAAISASAAVVESASIHPQTAHRMPQHAL